MDRAATHPSLSSYCFIHLTFCLINKYGKTNDFSAYPVLIILSYVHREFTGNQSQKADQELRHTESHFHGIKTYCPKSISTEYKQNRQITECELFNVENSKALFYPITALLYFKIYYM